MNVALVTAIGSFAADIVIKSLQKQNLRVVGTDIYQKEWIVDAYHVDSFYQVPLASEKEAYLDALHAICEKEQVNYILPLTDVEIDVLNANRKWFVNRGILLCISPEKVISVCRDKLATARLLSQGPAKDMVIPFLSNLESNRIPDSWFPVICKPINGRSSQGILRFSSGNEIGQFFQTVKEQYVIQPIIQGSVVTADLCRTADGSRCVVCSRLELLRTSNGAGTSVRIFHDPELERKCILIAEALGVVGCVNFEFIQSTDGAYYFIECNPRFSGGVEFSCMTGYDFVRNHLRCFLGELIDASVPQEDCYIARKYEEYITSRLAPVNQPQSIGGML